MIFKLNFKSFLESGSSYNHSGHDTNAEIWLTQTNFIVNILQRSKHIMKYSELEFLNM